MKTLNIENKCLVFKGIGYSITTLPEYSGSVCFFI